MTEDTFTILSHHLIGQTVRALYPGGDSTIGIGLDNGTFFCLTSRDFRLVVDQSSWVISAPEGETLVSEPSDGIL